MDYLLTTYVAYLLLSVPLTIWVGQTLYRKGGLFLIHVFHGDEALAQGVNQLLVVGFYLINLGYVSIALKVDHAVENTRQVVEEVSFKVGAVALVLGVMHFLNLLVLNRKRRRAQAPPPPPRTRPPARPDRVGRAAS